MPHRFAIVCSSFNSEYTDGLLASAQQGLHGHTVRIVRVPGAFEIPLQVQRLARTRRYHAILALGLVWHGQTAHAAEITRAVTDALMQISLNFNVPVVHQVLSVKNAAEAKARCLGQKLNRGTEAAATALVLAKLKAS
jgi:6,7-dimethyl-8-ribityllumazine synthase